MLSKILTALQSLMSKSKDTWLVEINDGQIVQKKNDSVFFVVKLDDIISIDSYNMDCVTYDCIALNIHSDAGVLSVKEFDEGFDSLVDSLSKKFSFDDNWQSNVTESAGDVVNLWRRDAK